MVRLRRARELSEALRGFRPGSSSRPERRGYRVTCAVKPRRTGTGERPVIAFPDETHVDRDFGPVTARVAKLSPHEPAIAA